MADNEYSVLAERCEAAVGAKLTLLARASEAESAICSDEFRIISEAALAVFGWQDDRYKRGLRLLEIGASLDAAMSLVPEGWAWSLSHLPPFGPAGKSDAVLNNTVFAENAVIGTAATPALALCAAALRARAATQSIVEEGV